VLGKPISHSLSPVLHRAAYDVLGIDWTYDAVELDEPELPDFIAGLDDSWAGLSLTMPLKRAVLPLLDVASPLSELVGAANTVIFTGGQRQGENTDVPGLVAALLEAGVTSVGSATVLGGGATATSALVALRELGVGSVTVAVRRPKLAGDLRAAAERIGVRIDVVWWADAPEAFGADVVVATTPAGSTEELARGIPRRVEGVLFDVVYAHWPTRLAAEWDRHGGRVVGGLDLLVHQAVLQVALMTGREVDAPELVAVMHSAGKQALHRSE
jgi:shikimate dehydrogenase